MNYLFYVDDCLIIGMVHVSLDLRYSRISWMLILYLDFIPCCLPEVTHRVMIKYNLRCSKVVELPTRDSPLQERESIPMASCRDHYSRIFAQSGNSMKGVFECVTNEK